MTIASPATINLASHPFRRERAQNVALAGICLALACSFLVLVSLILHSRVQARSLSREIRDEQAQLRRLQIEQSGYGRILSRPDNADVFATSYFLNQLIARRAISWTRVFTDLETVMPPNMRLVGIRLPQVAEEDPSGKNRVQLDMLVGSDKPETIIELLKRLEKSPLFGAAAVMSQQAPTQNDPLFRYRVTVDYAQKL